MLKHLILLFLGFAALASAALTPEKSFFSLSFYGLSSQIFQTRHGIIAYSVETANTGQYAPYYTQINLETTNVTQIIPDLPSACGQGPSIFDRFTYHSLTYSFVYYCTNNNSILLLDPQNNFQVHQVFSLSINQTFDEVRMITDGYSVAVLGISGLLSPNPGPSHLIKFNLQNQQVVNHVVFDHGLADGEFVTAYGTNGNFFIITNIINSTINIANVYGMTLIGNSYTLTRLTTFNSTSSSLYTIPEFYVKKSLIFTSNEDNLVILDENGNLQKVQEGITLREFPQPQTLSLYRPAIVSYSGSGALFVSLKNNTLLKFSVVNQGFNVEDQGCATYVSLAIQDQLTDTLIFAFSGENTDFRITNADSGEVVYDPIGGYGFMITDKTYASFTDLSVEICDRETNELIQTFDFQAAGYYDQKSSTFSFLNLNIETGQYNLQQIDLRTGNNSTLFSVNSTGLRLVELVHATNDENFDSPEFVIHMPSYTSDEFLIVSKTFGQVKFSAPGAISSTLAVDYDTLDVFYFVTQTDNPQVIVTAYSYVSSHKSFVSTKTNQYPTPAFSIDWILTPSTDYSVILSQEGKVTVIEMSSLNSTDYSIPVQLSYVPFYPNPNIFQNSSNGFKMVLSQGPFGTHEGTQVAGILSDNQVQELPGTTNGTLDAAVAGLCSYWIMSQVGSFVVVDFYNICDSDAVSEIIA